MAKSVGKGINEFKRASNEVRQQVQEAVSLDDEEENRRPAEFGKIVALSKKKLLVCPTEIVCL